MSQNPGQQRLRIWKQTLQDFDLRLTPARKAVMEILTGCDKPLTAQEIHDRARDHGHSLGIASVYRTLETLSDLDLIQRIHHPQGCEAFGPALTGHKHFLICTECERMVTFPGWDGLDDYFRVEGEKRGYQVKDHWLQLFGVCPKCQ